MEAALATLAASGSITLMGLLVSDAWHQVRERVGGLLARGGDDRLVVAELETTRAELVAAEAVGDARLSVELRAGWELRLRQLLRADPAFAAELRELLADAVGPPAGNPTPITVHNTMSGGTHYGPVVQAGTVFGSAGAGNSAAGAASSTPTPPPR